MTQVGIALDDIVEIADYSDATMLALAVRLEHSSAFQEIIAREIDLDELWRRVETGIKSVADQPAAAAAVMLPFYTSVAAPIDGSVGVLHRWVPMDDAHTYVWTVMWRIQRPTTEREQSDMSEGPTPHVATYDPVSGGLRGNYQNRIYQDRMEMKSETFSGIFGIREQVFAAGTLDT
jgi:hypothetical protein